MHHPSRSEIQVYDDFEYWAKSALREFGGFRKMAVLDGKQMFPCPVCTKPREVKQTKKRKPYLVCDPCGVQVFVRGPSGIAEFNRLVERAEGQGLLVRMKEMEQRYRLTCPECGHPFWIEPDLIKTSLLDGSLKGFRCPQKGCGVIVPWETDQ